MLTAGRGTLAQSSVPPKPPCTLVRRQSWRPQHRPHHDLPSLIRHKTTLSSCHPQHQAFHPTLPGMIKSYGEVWFVDFLPRSDLVSVMLVVGVIAMTLLSCHSQWPALPPKTIPDATYLPSSLPALLLQLEFFRAKNRKLNEKSESSWILDVKNY